MSSIATLTVQPDYPTEPVFPLSVEACHALIESGQLTHDDPVELIEGGLVLHMPRSPLHGIVVRAIEALLDTIFSAAAWHLRIQLRRR